MHRVLLPALLPGTRCHTDASTAPESSLQVSRLASHLLPPSQHLLPGPPLYRALCPALIPGPRCCTDGATAPDQPQQVTRRAGLGVFILDPQRQLAIYIKVMMSNTTSVIMAEAAALDCAASIASAFAIREAAFMTDNQQLVTFLNGNDHSSPPNWEIKPYTQHFINSIGSGSPRVFKIARDLNITAHNLASQALHAIGLNSGNPTITCNNQLHVHKSPLREALNSNLGVVLPLSSCLLLILYMSVIKNK